MTDILIYSTIFSACVGGIWVPVNKLSLLAPYIGLTIMLAVAVVAVVYVKKRKISKSLLAKPLIGAKRKVI